MILIYYTITFILLHREFYKSGSLNLFKLHVKLSLLLASNLSLGYTREGGLLMGVKMSRCVMGDVVDPISFPATWLIPLSVSRFSELCLVLY